MILQNLKIEATCKCTACDNTFIVDIKIDQVNFYVLRRVFEDTDDGFVLFNYIKCPNCNRTEEVELVRRKGWGM